MPASHSHRIFDFSPNFCPLSDISPAPTVNRELAGKDPQPAAMTEERRAASWFAHCHDAVQG
jgi:hypothetical protein